MKKALVLLILLLVSVGLIVSCAKKTVTDYDGNVYHTVTIGTQTWLKENLNTTHAPDGTAITRYCYDDRTTGCGTNYGGLYTWDTAMNGSTTEGAQGICPTGWHIPTDAEWKTLEMYLGMTQTQADATGWRGTDQGIQLKEGGSSGFEVLLAGHCGSDGSCYHRDTYTTLWSSTQCDFAGAWGCSLGSTEARVHRYRNNEAFFFSLRCLKD